MLFLLCELLYQFCMPLLRTNSAFYIVNVEPASHLGQGPWKTSVTGTLSMSGNYRMAPSPHGGGTSPFHLF